MNTIYIILYLAVLSVAFPVSLFSRKLRRGLMGRLGSSHRLKSLIPAKPVYWFQVASSGELEQCLPIMDELKSRRSSFILLTYFSPSAEKAITLESERRKPVGLKIPWDFTDYSPWDLPWVVRKIVKNLKPRAYITIHREIWPVLLNELKNSGTKTYLFSTYWPERSRKSFKWLRPWLRHIDFIGTVDERSAEFLERELPHSHIISTGDSRIDRVLERKTFSLSKTIGTNHLNSNKNFVGASLWPEDFEALKPSLRVSPLGWRYILVPHDPKTPLGDQIFHFFKKNHLPVKYWSQWLEEPDPTSHLIVDRVGFLAELYQIAKIVFVGGSFKTRVHNVLEPAAYGCPILTGPHIWNSNEAMDLGKLNHGLRVAANSIELKTRFLEWTADSHLRDKCSKDLIEYLSARRGAKTRYVDLLLN